jgi:hypothetical protein
VSAHCSWNSRKAERARLNPQDVGTHESETLFVSFDWVKQPKDLARAAGSHEKRRRASLNFQFSQYISDLANKF